MKFNRSLLKFKGDDVIYNDIQIGLTRTNLLDYVSQTGYTSEELILFYYKKSIDKIRDKQLEQLLNDREESDKVD